jgi:hypothetical protein
LSPGTIDTFGTADSSWLYNKVLGLRAIAGAWRYSSGLRLRIFNFSPVVYSKYSSLGLGGYVRVAILTEILKIPTESNLFMSGPFLAHGSVCQAFGFSIVISTWMI